MFTSLTKPVETIAGLDHVEMAQILLSPWEWLSAPFYRGLEHIPDAGPSLFVGNHTLMGVLDLPLMWNLLYREKGLFLRALGDRAHFRIPVWRDLLSRYGVVEGTRENCTRLMEAGEQILVFPGGAREVFKHKGERYKLIWKERLGFAKMAIRHKCPIVPFSSLGADECYDIILDSKEILNSPIGILLKKLSIRPDAIPPIVSGIGRTPIPKPQRLYFAFGEPVDTSIYGGDHENLEACKTVKEIAAKRIEEGIEKLKALREKDAKSSLKVRAARSILGPQAKRVLPLLRRLFEWEENSLEKLERLLE